MRDTFEAIGRHDSRRQKVKFSGLQIACQFLIGIIEFFPSLLFIALPRLLMIAVFTLAKIVFAKIEQRHPRWCRQRKFKFMRAVLRAPKGLGQAHPSSGDPWGEVRIGEGESLAPWVIRFADVIEDRILARGGSMSRRDVLPQMLVAIEGCLKICALQCLVPWMDGEWREARRKARPNPASRPFVSEEKWEGWTFEVLVGESHCSRLLVWMSQCGGRSMFQRFFCRQFSSRPNSFWERLASPWMVAARCFLWRPMALSPGIARHRLSAAAEARNLGRAILSGGSCDPDRWLEGEFVAESTCLRWLAAGGFGGEEVGRLDCKVLEESEALALRLLMLAITGLAPEERALATICWLEGAWLSEKSAGWVDSRSGITSIGSNEAFMAFIHPREDFLAASPVAIAVAKAITGSVAFGEMSKSISCTSIKGLARIAHGPQWELPFFLGLRHWRMTLRTEPVSGRGQHGRCQYTWSSKNDLQGMSLGRFIEFAFSNGEWTPAGGSMRDALLDACANSESLASILFGAVKTAGSTFLAELDSLIESEAIKSVVGAEVPAPRRRATRI